MVALDPDTGKLKWYYQFTPHDEMDYDSTQVPVLADIQWQGSPRKVMMWGNRNGVFYVLDRASGQFLLGKPFTTTNWFSGFDERGRPMRVPGKVPTPEGSIIMPTVLGGTNWYPPSYSPSTGFVLSLGVGEHRKQSGQGRPRRAFRRPQSHGASESDHQHQERSRTASEWSAPSIRTRAKRSGSTR